MAGASFTMTGMNKLLGGIRRLQDAARRQAAAEEIGEMLVSSTRERFDEGIGPDGEKWKPSIRAKADGGQTLVDNAVLKNSIGYDASPNLVAVGTAVEYAAIHQFGGTIRPKKAKLLVFEGGGKKVAAPSVTMPARPFIGISEDDIEEARQILLDHMREAFAE